MLLEQKNAPRIIRKELAKLKFECELIVEKNISGETLMVIRIQRAAKP